jgi:hypothetical protein
MLRPYFLLKATPSAWAPSIARRRRREKVEDAFLFGRRDQIVDGRGKHRLEMGEKQNEPE